MNAPNYDIGEKITVESPEYETSILVWNQIYQPRPKEILYCENATQVSNALHYAKDSGLEFRIRSSGHSNEGWSSIDDGIVIDVSRIKHFELLPGNQIRIGAGFRLSEINRALALHGLAFPGGTSYDVSVSGYTLGGGGGLISRSFGWGADNLIAAEVVDAEGNIVHADKDTNPDLFWALRGAGGGNFGIVTSFTLQVYEISNVVYYRVKWEWEHLRVVLKKWQEWVHGIGRELNSYFTVPPKLSEYVDVGGIFLGSEAELQQHLDKLVEGLPAATSTNIVTTSWTAAAEIIYAKVGDGEPWFHEHARALDVYPMIDTYFTDEIIDILEEWLTKAFDPNLWVWITAGTPPSEIDDKKNVELREQVSFNSRSAFAINARVGWQDPKDDDKYFEWFQGFYREVDKFAIAIYANWTNRHIEKRISKIHDKNFPELVKIKRKWDPHNVFHFPASIPTEVTSLQAEQWETPPEIIEQLKANGQFVE